MISSDLTVLGIMSGSSLDGLDLAMVRFRFNDAEISDWQVLYTMDCPFDGQIVNELSRVHDLGKNELSDMDVKVGHLIADAAQTAIATSDYAPDYIASHGHTVAHNPEQGFTVQIGSPAIISKNTGIPVISDFRSADIASGGQGAPLAPVVEKYLLPGHEAYINLGGIANVSVHKSNSIKAWDICPCNQILNYLARRTGAEMDRDGHMASSGNTDQSIIESLLKLVDLPHHNASSLDNKTIQAQFYPVLDKFNNTTSALASAVEFIALGLARQLAAYVEAGDSVFLSGGGTHNRFLTSRIEHHLSSLDLKVVIPARSMVDFKEAILMALCGALRVLELPNSFASVTGASEDTVNGKIFNP